MTTTEARPSDPGRRPGAPGRGSRPGPVDAYAELLAVPGVTVVIEAEHMCMSLRGVQKFGSQTVTSALHGLVRDDARTRQEFLALTTGATHAH